MSPGPLRTASNVEYVTLLWVTALPDTSHNQKVPDFKDLQLSMAVGPEDKFLGVSESCCLPQSEIMVFVIASKVPVHEHPASEA